MLTCYYSGLPSSAVYMLKMACSQLYGEGTVDLKEVDVPSLRAVSHQSVKLPSVVLFIVSSDLTDKVVESLKNSSKFLSYSTLAVFREQLESFGVHLESDLGVSEGGSLEYEVTILNLQERVKVLEEALSDAYLNVGSQEHLESDSDELEVENLKLKSDLEDLKRKLEASEGVGTDWLFLKDNLSYDSIPLKNTQVGDVRWVFSGSSDSIKESYSVLAEIVKEISRKSKVCVVDLCHESYLDYYFGNKLGSDNSLLWLFDQSVLKFGNSSLPNTVLIWSGLNYINPLSLLSVNWEQKFEALHKRGYEIVVHGGDISSLSGKFLANSLISSHKLVVVTTGLALSLRNLWVNLRTIRTTNLIVYMHSFNPKAQSLVQSLRQSYTVCFSGDVKELL